MSVHTEYYVSSSYLRTDKQSLALSYRDLQTASRLMVQ